MGVGSSYAAKSISCLLPVGYVKTLRWIESGSGIISFLAGMGSGNLRSLSPWKPFFWLAMLNYKVAVRLIEKGDMTPTRPLAKMANCSLGDKPCCSNVAEEAM